MKKQLLLFTFSFVLFTFSYAQTYAWQDISENIPQTGEFPPSLTDVFFVSDDEGWITSSTYPEIYHTSDGGATFEVQTTQYECNAIHMLNENEGYAGGAQGRVYRTTNGGADWIAIGSIGTTLADISFPPNGDTGYCCGLNGNIWSITSEGTEKMTSNINGNVYSVSFPINSEEGWVCGGSVIRHYKNEIWNGDQDMPSGGYNAIYMVDSLNGWVVGDGGIIAHTEDGMNWFEQINPDPQNSTLYNLFFLNSNEGWAVGLGSQILHTTNGGDNWTIIIVGDVQLNAVQFTSPTNGYVVGNGKTLLKYTEVSGIGEDAETLKFDIYPNPACSVVSLQSAVFSQQFSTVEIFDLNGRKLIEKSLPASTDEIEIDVSHLPGGVYGCKLSTKNNSVTKKLIIQK